MTRSLMTIALLLFCIGAAHATEPVTITPAGAKVWLASDFETEMQKRRQRMNELQNLPKTNKRLTATERAALEAKKRCIQACVNTYNSCVANARSVYANCLRNRPTVPAETFQKCVSKARALAQKCLAVGQSCVKGCN